jgi:hypothetical protein
VVRKTQQLIAMAKAAAVVMQQAQVVVWTTMAVLPETLEATLQVEGPAAVVQVPQEDSQDADVVMVWQLRVVQVVPETQPATHMQAAAAVADTMAAAAVQGPVPAATL